jgi:hypothetical protein
MAKRIDGRLIKVVVEPEGQRSPANGVERKLRVG